MSELLQLLDGSIDNVRDGLVGLAGEDLVMLRKAETDGKSRKGVLELLDAAIGANAADEPVEADQVVADEQLNHPAIDVDPRSNTTAEQNRIDFNDPSISGEEAVLQNLAAIEAAAAAAHN